MVSIVLTPQLSVLHTKTTPITIRKGIEKADWYITTTTASPTAAAAAPTTNNKTLFSVLTTMKNEDSSFMG